MKCNTTISGAYKIAGERLNPPLYYGRQNIKCKPWFCLYGRKFNQVNLISLGFRVTSIQIKRVEHRFDSVVVFRKRANCFDDTIDSTGVVSGTWYMWVFIQSWLHLGEKPAVVIFFFFLSFSPATTIWFYILSGKWQHPNMFLWRVFFSW